MIPIAPKYAIPRLAILAGIVVAAVFPAMGQGPDADGSNPAKGRSGVSSGAVPAEAPSTSPPSTSPNASPSEAPLLEPDEALPVNGSGAASETGAIRVETRLVEVDVIVTNGDGPVLGLSKADFELTDDGKPQEIAAFTVNLTQGYQRASVPLREGEVSNRVNGGGLEARAATVVLFDRLNTAVGDQDVVRSQVLDYLKSLEPGDQFALYSLSKSLRVIQDFTDDPRALIEAVDGENGEYSLDLGTQDLVADLLASIDAGVDGATAAMMANSAKELGDFALRNRAEITTRALREIARHLGGMPGRKKLVWVTSGFEASTQDVRSRNGQPLIEAMNFGRQIQRAVESLNDANVAVYPIDARGLVANAGNQGGLLAPGIDSLNLVAEGTGGEAYYARNDLGEAVREVVSGYEVTYTLGFYPNTKLDGDFHVVDVKLPGLGRGTRIRHRNGYVASAGEPPSDKELERSLDDTFSSVLESTGIGVSAISLPVEDYPGLWELRITFNLNEITVRQEEERYVAYITLATMPEGNPNATGSAEELRISLEQERFLAAMENGLTIQRLLDAGETSGKLRVAVQDRTSGRVGSVRVPYGNRN